MIHPASTILESYSLDLEVEKSWKSTATCEVCSNYTMDKNFSLAFQTMLNEYDKRYINNKIKIRQIQPLFSTDIKYYDLPLRSNRTPRLLFASCSGTMTNNEEWRFKWFARSKGPRKWKIKPLRYLNCFWLCSSYIWVLSSSLSISWLTLMRRSAF